MNTKLLQLGKYLLLSALLLCGNAFAANYPLEIISPISGLDTKNRFYKAYPGLEYNVRAGVIGGAYPFRYELTQAPAGMSVNNSTGEIVWRNPVTAGSPHAVNLRVTDQDNNVATVSWTVTVTTSGFKFIDAINGKSVANGGTGTIDNPWRSIRDMYEGSDYAAKYKGSYANQFVYFRSGTYVPDGFIEDSGRMALVNNLKPQVWLAYPGEKPVIDLSNYMIAIYNGGSNAYIDGFEIRNIRNPYTKGIDIASNANNVTVRRNRFHALPLTSGSNNQSFLMLTRNGKGSRVVVQDNEFYDAQHGYAVLGYDSHKVLVENNILHDFNEGGGYGGNTHGIGPKEATTYWFIRGNRSYRMNTAGSIWVMASNGPEGSSGDIEISYNNINDAGKALWLGQQTVDYGKMYSFRNTYIGGVVEVSNLTGTRGPIYFSRDVIVNGSSGRDHITESNVSADRLVKSELLSGFPADGIVDANGLLTDKYGSYRGTRGHETFISSRKPMAPAVLSAH